MACWVIGYVVGAYVSDASIALNVPGPIRRIVTGFYLDRPGGVTGPPVPLTPVAATDADNEVAIVDHTHVQIEIAAGLTNPTLYLLVELEHDYLSKQRITP